MRTDALSELVYEPLKEEDKKLTGWSKSTINYATENRTTVCNYIRGIAKSHGKLLQRSDIEDIYMILLQYMHSCDDYNICKAYERSSNSTVVSLEGYVYSCIKYCTLRYLKDVYKREAITVRDIISDEDGKESSLFDTVADTKSQNSFSDFMYQLDTICKSFEHQRYSFGPDIFQIWFVRLQTIQQRKQDKYTDILTILGITKKELAQVEKEALNDGAMFSIAKAVTLVSVEEAIAVLRNYTYSADKLERVIKLF